MSQRSMELKVGLFVFVCLAILAFLVLEFSKGISPFRNVYTITLNAPNVGGLRAEAGVLMSGVKVGSVSKTQLSPTGTNVAITLSIYGQFVIRDDARFVIEQSGFLGDQYIAIYPGQSRGQPFTNGATAHVEAPFNLQEAARSANGFIKRMDDTAANLQSAISDVRRLVLNETTLTNLSFTVATLKQASMDALVTVSNINLIIQTNGAPISYVLSNLTTFSQQLNTIAQSAQTIVDTNAPQISATISNLQTSTAMLTNLLGGVEAGQGLAGTLLKNPAVANDVSQIVNNLAITTSNLNRLGLWHFIWYHPKPGETNGSPTWPAASSVHP